MAETKKQKNLAFSDHDPNPHRHLRHHRLLPLDQVPHGVDVPTGDRMPEKERPDERLLKLQVVRRPGGEPLRRHGDRQIQKSHRTNPTDLDQENATASPWRSTNPKISQNKSNRFRLGKRGGKKMDSGFDAVGNGRGEGVGEEIDCYAFVDLLNLPLPFFFIFSSSSSLFI